MSLDSDKIFTAMAGQVLLEAWVHADAAYWRRRAAEFEAALPRPGDYIGSESTPEKRAERVARLAEIAKACRNRAQLADTARAEYLETLTAVSLGAAA